MPEFQLEFATRQIRRTFARAMGRSIPKILAELITNADDSYRRLEQRGSSSEDYLIENPAPILIVFERSKRRFVVIDHAEGLTDKDMEERFVFYGQESSDRASGLSTRSLFGKGLRDVLFTQHHGQVKSIKDGKFYNCRFRWKKNKGQERPIVDIRAPKNVKEELRNALQIPGNGTAVEFQLEKGLQMPQSPKLLRDLTQFYLLRMINSSPRRNIRLIVVGKNRKRLIDEQLSYNFPEWEVIDNVEDYLEVGYGNKIRISGEIGLTFEELPQLEVGYVEREGGILLLDEHDAVLDLHLFGFDEDPAARRISGLLRLDGAGQYIRERLNADEPEEILTETRDGLDKHHPFYRSLRDIVQPRIQPIVDELRDQGPQPKVRLSDKTYKRHQKALNLLNKLAQEMLGKSARVPVVPVNRRTPPPEGIEFVQDHVSIQVGVMTPVALLINTAKVTPADAIEISSDCKGLSISPELVSPAEREDEDGVSVKIIRLRGDLLGVSGSVSAKWHNKTAVIAVSTTDRFVITPADGLEFEREQFNVKLGGTRRLKLFVDLKKIPLNSTISASVRGGAVDLVEDSQILLEKHVITEGVAELSFSVRGKVVSKRTDVTATVGEYVARAQLTVTKKEKKEQGKYGLFKDYRFRSIERKVQSQFTPDGLILINTRDPVNASYFGDEPLEAVGAHLHCQVRLADLILTECLWVLVSQALESGRLDRRFPDNPETDVRSYVDEKKYEVGPEIHRLIVTKHG